MKKKILSILLAAVMLISVVPLSASAAEVVASGNCGDNLTWTLDDEGVLTISGSGAMYDYDSLSGDDSAPWESQKDNIKSVVIESGVTYIGEHAFEDCYYLENASIPEGVTKIGNSAFSGSALSSVTIPGSAKGTGYDAFWGCSSLESVIISEGVTSIDSASFGGCTSLESVTIPGSITIIESSAFEECTALNNVVIPRGVTKIEGDAFFSCFSLTNLTIPDTVTEFEAGAFTGVPYLNTIKDANGFVIVNDILIDYMIEYTESPYSAVVPSTVEKIQGAFYGHELLSDVTIPNSVTEIGELSFGGCTSLKTIDIPDSVEHIGEHAFYGSGLTSITLPNSIDRIEIFTFSECEALKEVIIPDSVTHIDYDAFYKCTALESIVIPNSVIYLDSYVFDGCTSLINIKFLGNAPEIVNGCFEGVTATAYYPEGNATWTSEVMQNYGGTITWVSYKVPYTLTIDAQISNGTVSVLRGEDVLASGDTIYDGETLTVSTVPADGHILDKVKVNDTEISGTTFTVSGDTAISASFKVKPVEYTVSFNANGGTGSMTETKVTDGSTYILPECSLTAPSNQRFKAWKIGEDEYDPGESYTVTADTTITAVWEDIPVGVTEYTVTASAGTGGRISPTSKTVEEGKSVTFTITPDNNYKIKTVTLDGEDVTNSVSNDTYTISSVQKAHAVAVTFESTGTGGGGTGGEGGTTNPPVVNPPVVNPPVDDPVSPDEPTVETNTLPDGSTETTVTWSDGKTSVTTETPEGDVSIVVTNSEGEEIINVEVPAELGESLVFDDVDEGDWFKESVDIATALGLFAGTSEDKFSPNDKLTRSMLVTVLHRLSGEAQYGVGEGSFGDVKTDSWYEDAVEWATAAGITSGTGNGNFDPNGNITREQLVTMIYRYVVLIGADITDDTQGEMPAFSDSDAVSNYAKEAMDWAISEGIIQGRGGKIAPKDNATRAEVATILVRLVDYLTK